MRRVSAPLSLDGSRNTSGLTLAERNEISKAKRAERARIRYHSMRPEIRQQQNAKRAELLRKARQRDEELCHLAETCQLDTLDDDTRRAIAEAQMRRARRAEQARAKYHRMNSEERRQYNAMRDAQRRQRKRAQEEARQRAQLNGKDSHGKKLFLPWLLRFQRYYQQKPVSVHTQCHHQ
ncbi:unnamed protein product [Haemonchus placei]|uniref:Uncharacterized protein n=1 Tax=Haemonchus placei TaxID=6290 RepID=A0A3P7VEL6_HAEPC|nr:unnamed protein product [Haemonchus placei]